MNDDWGAALADFDQAIKLDAKHALAYANRAAIRAVCPESDYRDGKKALRDAKTACKLTGWKAAFPLEVYAEACAEVGNFREAIARQKKLLEDKEYVEWRGPSARKRLEQYEAGKPYRLSREVPCEECHSSQWQ